jgi:hypothetical protein
MRYKPAYLDTWACRFADDFSAAFHYVPDDRPAIPGIRGPIKRGWRRVDLADVMKNASVLSEQEFAEIFPEVPPLPEIVHCDRVGPLADDSWCSDPTRELP